MTQQVNLVQALKKEAKENKAFNDACHVFALRKRARAGVTVHALSRRMEKEGFNYSKDDYVAVLKTLANLGFGRLDVDARGKVKALKDVKTTLQSIGEAACGEVANLESYRQRNRFSKIRSPRLYQSEVPKETPPKAPKPLVPSPKQETGFGVMINGKPVTLHGIEALSPEEIKELVNRFSSNGGAK